MKNNTTRTSVMNPLLHHSIFSTAAHPRSPEVSELSTPVRNSSQNTYGTRINMVYRCYLPVLTGFARIRRIGSSRQRPSPAQNDFHDRLTREFNPAIAGCRLQGTATSPSSTAMEDNTNARRE